MTSQKRELFGTDGIRGVAGEFPLTKESTFLIGRALGHDDDAGEAFRMGADGAADADLGLLEAVHAALAGAV